MNNPEAPQAHQENKGDGWNRWQKIAAIGGIAIASSFIGAGLWKHFDNSGEVEGYTPEHPVPAAIDNKLNIGSWNMHHETSRRVDQIAKIIRWKHLDVMALQEVNGNSLDDLEERLPGWYIRPVVTDSKARLELGNSATYNVIMTKQKPEDVKTKTIDGTSFLSSAAGVLAGLGTDVAHANESFKNAKDGRQEKRAAIAETIKIRRGKKLENAEVVVSHISGDPSVHEAQRDELMDFIKDRTKSNRPTIFCGDLNGGPEEIIPSFAKLGFIVPETGPTSVGSDKTIDYCAYYEAGILSLGDVEVLPAPKTDHYPIIGSWTIPSSK